jgi:hypothetical protein
MARGAENFDDKFGTARREHGYPVVERVSRASSRSKVDWLKQVRSLATDFSTSRHRNNWSLVTVYGKTFKINRVEVSEPIDRLVRPDDDLHSVFIIDMEPTYREEHLEIGSGPFVDKLDVRLRSRVIDPAAFPGSLYSIGHRVNWRHHTAGYVYENGCYPG